MKQDVGNEISGYAISAIFGVFLFIVCFLLLIKNIDDFEVLNLLKAVGAILGFQILFTSMILEKLDGIKESLKKQI